MKEDLSTNLYWESLRSFLAPVMPLLESSEVSEVIVNGSESTYYEKRGTLIASDIRFDESTLMAVARNLAQYVGKDLQEDTSHLAARFPDGSRVQVVLPPCSRNGVLLSIRRFSRHMLELDDLVAKGSLTDTAAEWLKILIGLNKNIIISGGTSSGKTSLLNILGSLVRPEERILILEDNAELQIEHPHAVSMEARPAMDASGRGEVTIRDLVRVSLRMRPDRIIVGEVRGGEALDLLQAMSTGHAGSMGTIHANEPLGCLRRLETLATYGTTGEIPLAAIRSQVASAVEVIVQVNRLQDGTRHVTHISEVLPLDLNGMYRMKHIFTFQVAGRSEDGMIEGELKPTGEESLFMEQAMLLGYDSVREMLKA